MTLFFSMVVPLGLVGIAAGATSLVRGHRTAANICAVAGLLTLLMTVGVYGWLMVDAFHSVAEAPPELKSYLLAEAISTAQMTLPLGAGLAMVCVLLSSVAWYRLRSKTP